MNIRDIAKAAEDQGWTVSRNKQQHWVFLPPTKEQGGPYVYSGTPSDWRSIRNFLAHARRGGLVYPVNKKGSK
jgi:hypothetical protein